MQERDEVIVKLARYAANPPAFSENAYYHARLCLLDAIGCAFAALKFPECTKLLGPWIPGTVVPNGPRVIGTSYILDPIQATFQTGALIRWLDHNDTFLAKEWAHPSDNLGMLLPLFDWLCRSGHPHTMHELLTALIQTYEIQGALALENSFNRFGLDHVFLVKIACAALGTKLLGGSENQIADAISQAIIDITALRTYRHSPNTGLRKSWAAGDAAARGLELALLTLRGEKGYDTPLSAPKWGLQETLLQGTPVKLEGNLASYIVENILFKASFPAEFHAQTAVEAAILLHPQVKEKIEAISSIEIATHEAALRIIDKKGPLKNHADRDHCMQYMVAVALLKGSLEASDYGDLVAKNPLIDFLRSKITLREEPSFTIDYLDPTKRSIASSLSIHFNDGSSLEPITIAFPIGHPRRRPEVAPFLVDKFSFHLNTYRSPADVRKLIDLILSDQINHINVSEFINKLTT